MKASNTKTNKPTLKSKIHKSTAESAVRPAFQTGHDLMVSLLIVSLLLNTVVAIIWLMLQVTSQYDIAFAQLFMAR